MFILPFQIIITMNSKPLEILQPSNDPSDNPSLNRISQNSITNNNNLSPPITTNQDHNRNKSPEIVSSSDTKITLRLPSRLTSPNGSSDFDHNAEIQRSCSSSTTVTKAKSEISGTSLPGSSAGSLINEPHNLTIKAEVEEETATATTPLAHALKCGHRCNRYSRVPDIVLPPVVRSQACPEIFWFAPGWSKICASLAVCSRVCWFQ